MVGIDPIRVGIRGQGRSGYGIHTRWLPQSNRFRIAAVADLRAERRGGAVPVETGQVRVQIFEECRRQNRLGRLPPAGRPEPT